MVTLPHLPRGGGLIGPLAPAAVCCCRYPPSAVDPVTTAVHPPYLLVLPSPPPLPNQPLPPLHLLAGGTESDFVLLSCAGQARPGLEDKVLENMMEAKRKGEESLRMSGLGYTIIRPGACMCEGGGAGRGPWS